MPGITGIIVSVSPRATLAVIITNAITIIVVSFLIVVFHS
jgi:hypothetical protein